MYNWADYVAADNMAEFKERFGIDANFTYDIYAINEELFAKLQGGATGQYDIAAPTAEYVPAMVEEGFLEKLDWSRIPNTKYINPRSRACGGTRTTSTSCRRTGARPASRCGRTWSPRT